MTATNLEGFSNLVRDRSGRGQVSWAGPPSHRPPRYGCRAGQGGRAAAAGPHRPPPPAAGCATPPQRRHATAERSTWSPAAQ